MFQKFVPVNTKIHKGFSHIVRTVNTIDCVNSKNSFPKRRKSRESFSRHYQLNG